VSGASARERPKDQGPPRVVILGGGYGGIYTALGLQKAARRGEIELSLVSQENFFLYQPMLAEVVSGSIEPPHIVNPIRRMLRHTNFYLAEIESVDAQAREVVVRYPGGHAHYERIAYDHLVVAVGSTTDLSRMPGMTEHAFPFKTLRDAFSLRNHLISVMERAEVENVPEELPELLTFVVVGGGYTGVEVAAEINAFVREAAKSYRKVDPEEVKVILLQGASRILPELNEAQAAFSQRQLGRQGIEVRLDTLIQGATAQTAVLGDGVEIPTRTLVAAVGSAPNRLLDTVPGGRDPRGRLAVDETLAVPEQPGIWAVGDCAAVPDLRKGGTCPPTAQYALRQARQLARNIRASIRGEAPRPFSYRSLGVFVPLGRFSAAADVMGLKISGFFAWWLYRTYYLSQLPRLERKLRVMFDWTQEQPGHTDRLNVRGQRHGEDGAEGDEGAGHDGQDRLPEGAGNQKFLGMLQEAQDDFMRQAANLTAGRCTAPTNCASVDLALEYCSTCLADVDRRDAILLCLTLLWCHGTETPVSLPCTPGFPPSSPGAAGSSGPRWFPRLRHW